MDNPKIKINSYNNKNKIFQFKRLYSKIWNNPNKENEYEWNNIGYAGILNVGFFWKFYGNQRGLMKIEFAIQLIFIYLGLQAGLNDDLFE